MAVRLTTDFHGNRGSDASEYDIAFTVEHWPRDPERFVVEPLFPVLISPACTPEIARCLSDPGDLASCTLLNEPLARDDWGAWLARFPVTGLDLKKSGSDFPNLDLATRAAIMGAGVVMADFLLCRDELSAGALVLPFPDMVCESPYGAVSLLGLRDTWDSAKVRAFRDWALEEAQADVQALKALGMS